MSQVVIVGAGPAGASLAFLLARQGIPVTLLERRRDFSREFRGEVLMPGGVDALLQMGLGSCLEKASTSPLSHLAFYLNGRPLADETISSGAFPGGAPFLVVSQAELLEAIVEESSQYDNFVFHRGTSITQMIRSGDRINGIKIRDEQGEKVLPADLVIGADGRKSTVRKLMGIVAEEKSPPMDIVWCKLPLPPGFDGVRVCVGKGHLLVAYRSWDDQLQMAWVIIKGSFGELKEHGTHQWLLEMSEHVPQELAAHLQQHAEYIEKPFYSWPSRVASGNGATRVRY